MLFLSAVDKQIQLLPNPPLALPSASKTDGSANITKLFEAREARW